MLVLDSLHKKQVDTKTKALEEAQQRLQDLAAGIASQDNTGAGGEGTGKQEK